MTPDPVFLTGIVGSLILIFGAAWPVGDAARPVLSRKNQLFAAGNVFMCTYAVLRYFEGGSFFFVLLQGLVIVSTVLMLRPLRSGNGPALLACVTSGLMIYALSLFEDVFTLVFVAGIGVLAVGFAAPMRSLLRQAALAAGSALIALFSYVTGDGVFLWLNIFFALFSAYYAWKIKTEPNRRFRAKK